MPRSSPLPPRLRYLEPVRKYLTSLGPDGLNEGTDLTRIRKVVRKRIKGLSAEQARTALNDDGDELEKWLSSPNNQNDVLNFLLPFLAMDAADVLLEEPVELPPEYEVFMELPEGAKVSKESGCWSVKWRKKLLVLLPSDKSGMQREAARFRDEAQRRPMLDGDGSEVADVEFGNVKGIKRIYVQTWPAAGKQVNYALEVPGGYMLVTLCSAGSNALFDESEVEAKFPTLRVISQQRT